MYSFICEYWGMVMAFVIDGALLAYTIWKCYIRDMIIALHIEPSWEIYRFKEWVKRKARRKGKKNRR